MTEFFEYYRANLDCLRGLASEFAAEFPKVAARLELTDQNCQDPYVERLLEGAAFLAARVEHKLDCGFPRLLETVLSSVSPLTVNPVPSYAVLRFDTDASDERLRMGVTLPAGTAFRCSVEGVRTPCTYTTMRDVFLSQVRVLDVAYRARELASYGIRAPAALSVTLEGLSGAAAAQALEFCLALPESESSLLQGQLVGDLEGVYVCTNGRTRRVEGATVSVPMVYSRVGEGADTLHGIATLQRYLACPSLYKFFRIEGLDAVGGLNAGPVEVLLAFTRRESAFLRNLSQESLLLGCVPAVNLFPRRADRTEYGGAFEHHVLPDRSAPLDYEVYRILSVEAFDERNRLVFEVSNTYESDTRNHFVPHRRARPVGSPQARSSYRGSEVYVSLSGPDCVRMQGTVRQLGASLQCTNRDLPLLLGQQTPLLPPSGAPVLAAHFLAPPSPPHPPALAAAAQDDWTKLAHLMLNLSSVFCKSDAESVGQLRDLVRAYGKGMGDVAERLADGLRTLKVTPRTFRYVRAGAVYFESGWQVDLALDEEACAGSGVFIVAAVLKEVLFAYVPIGVGIELRVVTERRPEGYRWRT